MQAHRFCECFLYGPTILNPEVETIIFQTQKFSPLGYGFFCSHKLKRSIVRPVSALLFAGGPLNVAGFVVHVIIDSFYRVLLGGSGANLSEESLEASEQNSNASAAVSVVVVDTSVITALLDMLPSLVFNGMAFAVRRKSFRGCFNA